VPSFVQIDKALSETFDHYFPFPINLVTGITLSLSVHPGKVMLSYLQLTKALLRLQLPDRDCALGETGNGISTE